MSSTRGNIEELLESLSERRDRRAFPRTNSPLLTYIDLGDCNGGIALNISEGGLAITAAGTLLEDYFPNIRFQLPTIPGWIETSGRVIWTSKSKKGAGICFDGITELDRQKIHRWISSKASRGEVEAEASYDPGKNHFLDSAKAKKEPRKLEVLSEADEARFAAMFPSESTLRIAPDHNWKETEVAREISERVEQNPQKLVKYLPDDTNREDLNAESFVEQSSESTESISAPNAESTSSEQDAENSEPDSHDAGPATDTPPAADESTDTIVFPRRRWIIGRPEDSPTREELPTNDHRISQLEAVDSLSEQDHMLSEENENTVQASLPDEDEDSLPRVGPPESPAAEDKTPPEWTLPTFTYLQETDWRQQFVWNRGAAVAQSTARQAVEEVPQSNKIFRIAGGMLLVAAVCFAGGLMVGTGSVRKLLRLDGPAVATNPPAVPAAESSSPKSNEALESATQQPKNESSPASHDGFPNNSTNRSKDAAVERDEMSDSNADAAQSAEPEDDQEPPASDRRPQARNLAPLSGGIPSGGLRSQSGTGTEQTPPKVPTAVPSSPGFGLRSQSQQNPSTPNYSEATVDKPYSELQSPVLVTPPDEKSGPFRLAFPEAAVSASRTLAISAQRFVSIPVQAGPASSHRPERLQAGVLIYHADPVLPTSAEEMGGTVKVRATIGKSGDVVGVRAISGPPSLIPTVVRAVREWRYTVTLLDGQPLGAEEDVVVEFRPKS
jgi:PilZ domain/Gram-negative bacterial TonB protein C-terminal